MQKITTILSEILKLIPQSELKNQVNKYKSDRYAKKFTTCDQLVTLIYSQARGLNSLREIEICLALCSNRWYHLWFSGMKRSTLSEAMARRNSQVFENLFYCTDFKFFAETATRYFFHFSDSCF
jgi:Domain of unknown function (DUF4372)